MSNPRVEVDFNEYDRVAKQIPISRASLHEIEGRGIAPREGLLLQLYAADLDDDGNPAELVVDGRIQYDAQLGVWVACVNPETFRHVVRGH